MTRLDENRALTQLAQKAGVPVSEVSELCVWGNHSPTMFPDFYNARIGRQKLASVITDESWLKDTFVPTVGQRGKAIIEARALPLLHPLQTPLLIRFETLIIRPEEDSTVYVSSPKVSMVHQKDSSPLCQSRLMLLATGA